MIPYSKNSTRVYTFTLRTVKGPFAGGYANSITAGSTFNGFKRTDDWRSLIGRGNPATTPASGTMALYKPGGLLVQSEQKVTVGPNPYTTVGVWQGDTVRFVLSAPPTVPQSLRNEALSKFFARCAETQRSFQGLTVLGELRSTVAALKHPFRDMVRLLEKRDRHLAARLPRGSVAWRLRGNSRKDFLRAAAGTWLETQFHLKPTVSDIASLAHYIAERTLESGKTRHRVSARAVRTRQRSDAPISNTNLVHGTVVQRGKFVYEDHVRIKGVIWSDPVAPRWLGDDFRRLGLGFDQFVPTLLELSPWSFLLDYASNLSEVVGSFNVPRHRIAWWNETVRASNKVTIDSVSFVPKPAQGNTLYDGEALLLWPGVYEYSQFSRSGGGGLALPRPEISFDLPNARQFTNIVALAAASYSKSGLYNPRSRG